MVKLMSSCNEAHHGEIPKSAHEPFSGLGSVVPGAPNLILDRYLDCRGPKASSELGA